MKARVVFVPLSEYVFLIEDLWNVSYRDLKVFVPLSEYVFLIDMRTMLHFM